MRRCDANPVEPAARAAVIMYVLFGIVLLVISGGGTGGGSVPLGRAERENRFDDLRGRLRDTVRLALGQQRVLHGSSADPPPVMLLRFIVLFLSPASSPWSTTRFRIWTELLHRLQALRGDVRRVLLLGVAGPSSRISSGPRLTNDNDDTFQLLLIGAIASRGS